MMNIKKNEQNEVTTVFDVNENILNIISPSGIDFDNLHTSLGENVGKIYAITRYAYENEYGWLAPLCNLEGTSTTIQFRYTDPASLIDTFNRRLKELERNKDTIKDQSEKDLTEKAIEDIKKMIKRLAVQQEPVGYINILLHIQDISNEKLVERIKNVTSIVATNNCNMRLLKYRQGKGLKVIAPYGIPNDDDVFNMGMRNMPISTFFGGFPMANPGLNDEGGYYLGRTTNKKLVMLNIWLRGNDRTNSNWVIFGPPGIGKSTLLKLLLMLEYAFGTRIIVLDPEEEYVELARHQDIKGDVINCGRRGVNPLQARKVAVVREGDLEPSEKIEDFFEFEEKEQSDIALYLQLLRTFFKLYWGKDDFTQTISAILEENILELYEEFGINFETDVETIPNNKWPLPENLYDKIKSKSKNNDFSDYTKGQYEKLGYLLYSMAKGADSYLWNHYTTLHSDADFVDLVVSLLQETDDNVKNAQFFNILSWSWGMLSQDRTQKALFLVDEGHLFVDPDYPDIMKYLKNYSKRLRKYESGLMFVTHSVVDVDDPSVRRYGRAIINNACYKFIMGCDGLDLDEAKKIFKLSESETNFLGQMKRGEGILFAGNTRLQLKVDVCDKFLEMMGTAGGR